MNPDNMESTMIITRLAGALALVLCASPALAADTAVTIPIGEWASSLLMTVASVAVPIIMWALRFLPASIAGIIRTAQVEQVLQKAIDYGVNAVAGAAKGKTLDVNLGNQVLAEAIEYALRNGPGWVEGWLGGREGVRERIIARLNVAPEAAIK